MPDTLALTVVCVRVACLQPTSLINTCRALCAGAFIETRERGSAQIRDTLEC